jgi:hypothetical protein
MSARITIDGNNVLYHFFQSILLESNSERFREITALLINALAVWLPNEAYTRLPILVPYAVRDPKCRGDKSRGKPDEWGMPNNQGCFRDDNSLIKGLPRSLPIRNPSNRLVDRRYLGRNYVASHIWRLFARVA